MEFIPQLIVIAGVLFAGCISPGPDFIAVTSLSLASRRAGIGAAFGITLACLTWATLAIFGLGLLLTRLSWLYGAIHYIGAAYLAYLGIRMLLSPRHEQENLSISAVNGISGFGAVRRGLLVGLTNPKSAAFFGSLFITVIPAHAPVWVYLATLAIVAVIACGWFCIMAVLFSTGRVRSLYAKLRRPLDAVIGSVLVGIGAKLAFDR